MSIAARSIVEAARPSLFYADNLLKDVTPAMFARFPSPGGAMISTNHPAFVYGHLALYPSRMAENAGRDPGPLAVPASYAGLFGAGVECRDDAGGTIYPPMEEIVSHFRRTHTDALAMIAEMTDEELSRPPATARSREFMPTVGSLAAFLFVGHTMMHFGQVSAWRRAMGLGPAM